MVLGGYSDPQDKDQSEEVPPSYSESVCMDDDEDPTAGGSSEQNAPFPVIRPDDAVIAVMGVTGVGKSTFISHFNTAAVTSDGLTSCTFQVGIHEALINGRKVFLIDTPGFDDTHRSDTDILREVADWLNRSYQAHIKLAGIIYLHRINDVRMTGASMKNLRMFKKLCGDKGLSSVVLATTMWSSTPTGKEIQREQELISNEEFWAGMIRQGSTLFRQDRDAASATQIILFVLEQRTKITLKIQEEMANGKRLDETSAGQEVQAEIEKLKTKHQKEMDELRKEMREAQAKNDREAQEEIAAIRADLDRKVREEEARHVALRVSMQELQKQRDEELHQERLKELELEMKHKEKMWAQQVELESLKAKSQVEAQLIEANFANQMKEAELARYRQAESEREKRKKTCIVM